MPKDPFSHLIIGKAMKTHSALGPGLVEEFYHQHLVSQLRADGIEHLSKPRFDLIYRGYLADTFEPDLVFPGKLIPELKALRGEFAPSHYTQLLAYLKTWQISVGLLIDFGKSSSRRRHLRSRSRRAPIQSTQAWPPMWHRRPLRPPLRRSPNHPSPRQPPSMISAILQNKNLWLPESVGILLLLATSAFAEVKTETITISMRDGVKLIADLYRDDALTEAPVILTRTPYDRTKQKGTGEKWAKAGYIFIAQDCRGKFGSAGEFAPYNNEGQDGFDTIEWITRQPWCSGRVAMMGGSYVGAVQWQAAVEHPPGLAAIAPQATWSSFYRNLYLGGSVRLALIAGWIAGNSPKPDGAKPNDFNEAYLRLPLSEVDSAIGWDMPWLDAFLTHPEPDGFWTRLDLTPRLPELKLPALHLVGYYDFFSRESVDNFVIMQKQARDAQTRQQQRLILGPWDHGSVGKTKVADVEFGPEAAVDTFALQLDWFDRHLKQDAAALSKPFPPVRYFSMGDNVWHDAQTWPPNGFTATSFYLSSEGNANTRQGNGRLTREAPTANQPADTFRADPANPTPSTPVTEARPLKAAVWGPVDQSATEDRDDVLVYTSEPMTAPLTFAGNAEAKLHVSADTPDADWAVKLIDVHPDGFAQNIARGILRGRYRNSLSKPELMKPGQAYEITVDLGPVAATIAKGHQLRVDISGADFPLYDRNPNTAEGIFSNKTAIATEQVHHQPGALSRLILPVK